MRSVSKAAQQAQCSRPVERVFLSQGRVSLEGYSRAADWERWAAGISSPNKNMRRKQDIQHLIEKYSRHLQKLKEQKANFGLHTPPYILTEIEDIETKLENLNEEFISIETGRNQKGDGNKGRTRLLLFGIAIVLGVLVIFVLSLWVSPKLSTVAVLHSTPTPFSGKISFISLDNPEELNANLQWDAGKSDLSVYTVFTDTIYLTAGPYTWPNFPTIYYKQPIEGDFEGQVRVNFRPPVSKIFSAQMVGLAARPLNARLVEGDSKFPMDWAVVSKNITNEGSLVGCRGSWVDYSLDVVYLRIEKNGNEWRCGYSRDGEHWTRLGASVDGQSLSGKQLEIALFAYSDTTDPITVEFSEWTIVRK